MKNQLVKTIRELPGRTLATLLITGTSAFAGDMTLATAPEKTMAPVKMEEKNPLSFFGGKLVFDLQERLRFEARENTFDFNDALDTINDDSWLLQRFRIGVAIKPVAWLKIYAQAQDSREAYSDRPDFPGVNGAEGDDTFDLRQGYLMIGTAKGFSLTAGRQILAYGDERLVGSFDWNNIGRTFDAAKLRYAGENWSIDAFASTVVVPERGSYNQSDFLNGNENNREQIFSGIYFSSTQLAVQTTDLYVFQLHENTNARYLPAAAGNTDFATFGFRIKSKPGVFHHQSEAAPVSDGKTMMPPVRSTPKLVGLDYEAEGAFQTGEVRGLDLTAFAVHAGLGYTFDAAWKPRIGVQYNYASGDGNSADGDIETFQNLFPTNHKFYGIMDLFSWQNMSSPGIDFTLVPCKTITIKLESQGHWVANNDDSWYRANGVATVRPLSALARNADSYQGTEADIVITWTPKKWGSLQVGYGHFLAGDYLNDTGAGDDADFGYVQTTLTF